MINVQFRVGAYGRLVRAISLYLILTSSRIACVCGLINSCLLYLSGSVLPGFIIFIIFIKPINWPKQVLVAD